MSIEDNGGPAFPTNESNYQRDYSDPGMSLRDYFAAKAMQGICATDTYTAEKTAKTAYEQADAMLEARKK